MNANSDWRLDFKDHFSLIVTNERIFAEVDLSRSTGIAQGLTYRYSLELSASDAASDPLRGWIYSTGSQRHSRLAAAGKIRAVRQMKALRAGRE